MFENVSMPTESPMETDEASSGAWSREYFIDSAAAKDSHRSLSVLVSSRQCYMGLSEDEIVDADPQDFIDQISAHCSQQQDFLLPDTPMKEAMFRVLLSGGNELKDARAIGMALAEKWAMTPFPRDTSPRVVRRLLDNSAYYCIAPAPDSEAPEGE